MIKIDTAPLSGMTLSLLALAGLESSAESPDGGWAHKSGPQFHGQRVRLRGDARRS
jgi:hypothetical protein